MAYPYSMTKIGGAGVSMQTKTGQAVIDPVIDNVTELVAQIPTFAMQSYTTGLVVNDANAGNSYAPTSGSNPVLGTNSVTSGYYIQLGDIIIDMFSVWFGTSGVSRGEGPYRIRLSHSVHSSLRTAHHAIGWCHLIDHNAANAYGELGPGATKHATLHVTESVYNGVAGIVIGTHNTSIAPSYTITNAVTDRAYNANATSVDELADVVSTLISDIDASRGATGLATTQFDNAGVVGGYGAPWDWDTEDKVTGMAIYRKA